nr:SDR family NAD(P)-dependent oxidoreductase [Methylogaea oryzae]
MTDPTRNLQETALVTGATSGIGAELARLFAADGVNLVLVARDAERLAVYAEEIKARYAVEATALAQDLSQPGAAQQVHRALQRAGIRVDYLVNNAGVGSHGDFAAVPLERQLSMMRLNMEALVGLSHCLLPDMLARKSGKLLNVAPWPPISRAGPAPRSITPARPSSCRFPAACRPNCGTAASA